MGAYLDYNATTPLDPRVRAGMDPWLDQRFGNASSRDHAFGWDAAAAVEAARAAVALAIRVGPPAGVVFMSGATEGLSTVLRAYVGFSDWAIKRIVVGATEHDAVRAATGFLARRTRVPTHVLPVDACGHVQLEVLNTVLDGHRGALVAVMAANNEIGTVARLHAISEIVHAAGGWLLCDATQACGKMTMDLNSVGVDFAVVSAHKMCGPKGCGAMTAGGTLSEGFLEPLVLGGGQERGLRGGTLNVPGIVGLGEACRLAQEELDRDVPRITALRDWLEEGILSQVSDTWANGDRASRLCNTSNVGFRGIDARTLIRDMHDVAVSTRSACSSGNSGASHVLKAIGLSDEDAYSCVRFSLGRFTTRDEIDYALAKIVASAHKLRRLKSLRQ